MQRRHRSNIRKLFVLLFAVVVASFSYSMDAPFLKRPFKTDYCTGYFNGRFKHPGEWKKCCVVHDLWLWAGGDHQACDEADQNLKSCVAATGARGNSKVMYRAIRIGEHSPIQLGGQQWGNAWSNKPRYQVLNATEVDLIKGSLKKSFQDGRVPLLTEAEVNEFLSGLEKRNLPISFERVTEGDAPKGEVLNSTPRSDSDAGRDVDSLK